MKCRAERYKNKVLAVQKVLSGWKDPPYGALHWPLERITLLHEQNCTINFGLIVQGTKTKLSQVNLT